MLKVSIKKELIIILSALIIFNIKTSSQDYEIVMQSGHVGPVNVVKFNPKCDILASASADQTIKLWEVQSGLLIRTLIGHKDEVTDISFSVTGDTLVSSSKDNTIKLWDVKSGGLLKNYCCSQFMTSSVDIHPYSRIILSGSLDNEITFWNILDTLQPIKKIVNKSPLSQIRFSKDGKMFYSSDDSGNLNVYKMENPEKVYKTLSHNRQKISCFDLSDEANVLITKCNNDSIYSWDLSNYKLLRTDNYPSNKVCLSSDGRYYVIQDASMSSISIINLNNGKIERKLPCDTTKTTCFSYSNDKTHIAGGFETGKVLVWDVEGSKMFKEFTGRNFGISDMDYSFTANKLATIINSNQIGLWDFNNEIPFKTIPTTLSIAFGVIFDKTGNILFICGKGFNGGICRLDLNTDNVYCYEKINKEVVLIDVNNNNNYLLAGTIDSIFIYDLKNEIPVASHMISEGYLQEAHFAPKRNKIVFSNGSNKLGIWDYNSKRVDFISLAPYEIIKSFCCTASGDTLIIGDGSGNISEYNLDNLRLINTIRPKTLKSRLNKISVSKDSRFLAFANNDNSISIYDYKDGFKERIKFNNAHINIVDQIKFYSNNIFLFSSSTDGLIKMWNLDDNSYDGTLSGNQNSEWAIITRSGRYDGSANTLKELHWVINNKPIPVTTSFEKMYQPGIVHSLFNKSSYYTKELSADENAVAGLVFPPIVKIIKPMNYDTVDSKKVDVKFEILKSTNNVSYLRFFQNGKIVYSKHCIIKNEEKFSDSKEFELSPGKNLLEIKVLDEDKNESIASIIIFCKDETAKLHNVTMHIVSIGISYYGNNKYNLYYAKDDAEAFGKNIIKTNNLMVDSINYFGLFDSIATKEKLLEVLNQVGRVSRQEDIFILFFAGHGFIMHDSIEKEDKFSFALTNSLNSEVLSPIDKAALLSTEELSLIIEKINARKQLIIIDACYSSKAIEIYDFKKNLSSFAWKTGVSLLSATSSKSAWELHSLKHGLFTYVILEGISGGAAFFDKKVTVSTLKSYVDYNLPIFSRQYLKEDQVPFGWVAGMDFIIGEVE